MIRLPNEFYIMLAAGQVYNNGWSLWGSNTKPNDAFGKLNGELTATNMGNGYGGNSRSHCSTVEKLYAWEKKLYQEVKVMLSLSHISIKSLVTLVE